MKSSLYSMRFFLAITYMVMNASIIFAQDIISMRNGDIIKAVIQEISQTEIKYKKHSNPNGPFFIVDKGDVLSILYANGEQEILEGNANVENKKSSNYIDPIADEENDLIKEEVNIHYANNFKVKNKAAKKGVPLMWVTENSIVSTKDISMRIIGTFVKPSGKTEGGGYVRYFIELANKTQKNIYIDKVNSFRIDQNGMANSFFDNRIMNFSNSQGAGMGIGLGSITNALGIGGILGSIANGISVGRGSSHGTSTTYIDESIMIIPPNGKRYISEERYENNGDQRNLISEAESYMFDVAQIGLKDGEVREFNDDNTPYHISYIIIYSSSPDFKSYSSLNVHLYAKYIIGKSVRASFWKHYPGDKEYFENEKDFYNAYGNVIPNIRDLFGKIIIGRDFTEQKSRM